MNPDDLLALLRAAQNNPRLMVRPDVNRGAGQELSTQKTTELRAWVKAKRAAGIGDSAINDAIQAKYGKSLDYVMRPTTGDYQRSALSGATFGLNDEIAGLLSKAIPGGAGYKETRDIVRANQAGARYVAPKRMLATEIAGGVIPGIMTAGAAGVGTRGLSTAERALAAAETGGALGALGGFGHSEATTPGGIASDVSSGFVMGTGVGLGGSFAAQALGKAARPILERLRPERAVARQARGVMEIAQPAPQRPPLPDDILVPQAALDEGAAARLAFPMTANRIAEVAEAKGISVSEAAENLRRAGYSVTREMADEAHELVVRPTRPVERALGVARQQELAPGTATIGDRSPELASFARIVGADMDAAVATVKNARARIQSLDRARQSVGARYQTIDDVYPVDDELRALVGKKLTLGDEVDFQTLNNYRQEVGAKLAVVKRAAKKDVPGAAKKSRRLAQVKRGLDSWLQRRNEQVSQIDSDYAHILGALQNNRIIEREASKSLVAHAKAQAAGLTPVSPGSSLTKPTGMGEALARLLGPSRQKRAAAVQSLLMSPESTTRALSLLARQPGEFDGLLSRGLLFGTASNVPGLIGQ